MRARPSRHVSGLPTVHCGNDAGWSCKVSIWEKVKLIAIALAISVAMTAGRRRGGGLAPNWMVGPNRLMQINSAGLTKSTPIQWRDLTGLLQ